MTPRERADKLVNHWRGLPSMWTEEMSLEIEQAINAAVEEEREACAQVADAEYDSMRSADVAYGGLLHVAEKIRARDNNGGTK